jgi:primosomal protein N' (replication factor Y)
MRDEFLELGAPVVFSRTAQRLLREALERGEQGIILMNRRGFSHRVFCPACKSRIACPNCAVGLVTHVTTGESICHYCRARIPTPVLCPNVACREKLISLGHGTQKVEAELRRLFPTAKAARVDSDTMRHRTQYQQIIDDLEARRIDVIVGTQMIAKGLDFPHVSFVGVMHADGAGMAGDFRSHERLFQLVTQVAGRAGRASTPGEVVVQTMMPELPALTFALAHDYEAFAASELEARREASLPCTRARRSPVRKSKA